MSYIVLSYDGSEVLPVGSFEVWEQKDGGVAISSLVEQDRCLSVIKALKQ